MRYPDQLVGEQAREPRNVFADKLVRISHQPLPLLFRTEPGVNGAAGRWSGQHRHQRRTGEEIIDARTVHDARHHGAGDNGVVRPSTALLAAEGFEGAGAALTRPSSFSSINYRYRKSQKATDESASCPSSQHMIFA